MDVRGTAKEGQAGIKLTLNKSIARDESGLCEGDVCAGGG